MPDALEGEIIGPAPGEPVPQPAPEELKRRGRRTLLEDITVERVERFLEVLAESGRKFEAATEAGLSYNTILRLEKDDPEFKEWIGNSMQQYREILERECHRRAVEGWDEPVFSQRLGTQMGTVRKYDQKLLELMLKRHIPEYREKFEGEIKVTGGVLVAPVAPVTADAWEQQFSGPRIQLVVGDQKALPDASTSGTTGPSTPGDQQ